MSERVKIYTPNRLLRRRIAGFPCSFCGNAMHFRDITALQQEGQQADYAHPRCLGQAIQPGTVEKGGREPSSTESKESVTDEEV